MLLTLLPVPPILSLKPLLLVPTLLLVVSVVYCQVHYGVDAVAGIGVGCVAWWIGGIATAALLLLSRVHDRSIERMVSSRTSFDSGVWSALTTLGANTSAIARRRLNLAWTFG